MTRSWCNRAGVRGGLHRSKGSRVVHTSPPSSNSTIATSVLHDENSSTGRYIPWVVWGVLGDEEEEVLVQPGGRAEWFASLQREQAGTHQSPIKQPYH